MRKNLLPLLSFLLIIYASIAFLTWRVLQNQHKTAQFNQRQQAITHVEQLQQFIELALSQAESRLSAITQFLDTSPTAIEQLIDRTPIIKNVFILEKQALRYPQFANVGLSDEEQRFKDFITPFIEDPTRLQNPTHVDEGNNVGIGWYNALLQHRPALIYSQKKGNLLIAYELSYATFRARLIANADKVKLPGFYTVLDNGQALFSGGVRTGLSQTDSKMISHSLNYPLQHWQIHYYTPRLSSWGALALPIVLSALAMALVVTMIAVLIYRSTQRNLRLAAQQVQFVGQVSHELKTPLTNIQLYAELLNEQYDNVGESEQTPRYLGVIMGETHRLTRLIQNVLNFTRSPTPNRHHVDLSELIDYLQTVFHPTFSDKNMMINLKKQLIGQGSVVYSDRDMLLQMLSNFMSNAEKYAADGKQVDIELSETATTWVLAVRDYGKGVAKSELKKLSKPFYRVNNHVSEGVAGTGIGLSIVEQLAKTLGATLNIENAQPGLRFALVLPKK